LEIQRPVVGGRGLALREIWVGGGRGGGLKYVPIHWASGSVDFFWNNPIVLAHQ